MTRFIHVDRAELVTASGQRVGLTLRRNGFWWSIVGDDGCVFADTENEHDAREEMQRRIDWYEERGGCLRKRWRDDKGVTC